MERLFRTKKSLYRRIDKAGNVGTTVADRDVKLRNVGTNPSVKVNNG